LEEPAKGPDFQPKIKTVLSGCLFEELPEILSPLPRYRSKQVFAWISRGVLSFDEMTDLPLELRRGLQERFLLYSSEVSSRLEDPDGTQKLQILLQDGCRIEAVLLCDGDNRKTACLSTQAGCPAGCVFCKTGSLKFKRNLVSAEIVEQFLYLKRTAGEDIANIVVMGMGEPLLNLEELRRSLAIITGKAGTALSPRRITVSTSGIASGIRDLAQNGPRTRLALSLTTADEPLRKRLMPVTNTNPLAEVKNALLAWQKTAGLRITLETVLLGGINTRKEDVNALEKFMAGLDAVVNLIPWNPVDGMCFEGAALREPGAAELAAFTEMLEKRGIKYTRRYRKGRGVGGACGQLGLT
jgi:23S rRNA (adenine2503-C2)-methyltransferase